MARINRRLVLSETEIQTVKCVNRCVRRAFLCGDDPLTGRNLDHRKVWIRDRLAFLAGIFSIDVLSYSVLSDQLTLTLRSRPDIAGQWDDLDVAKRWWRLFPQRRLKDGSPDQPTDLELRVLVARVTELRPRLSSISWFMRCTAEVIARWANAEDQCTGRFWEGRFKCTLLNDEAAILGGLVHVDLLAIQRGFATSPEESTFTGLNDRIHDALNQSKRTAAANTGPDQPVVRTSDWLSPMKGSDGPSASTSASSFPQRRASDRCCVDVSLNDYRHLAEWTLECIRVGGPRCIQESEPQILRRMQLDGPAWLTLFSSFSRRRKCAFPINQIFQTGAPGPVAGITGNPSPP